MARIKHNSKYIVVITAGLSLIYCLYLLISNKHSSSDLLASSLKTDLCSNHFESLYSENKNWKIKEFSKRKSLFGGKNAVNKSIQHLRIYNQCFINSPSSKNNSAHIDLKDIEKKLYPSFTRESPIFTRWDGTIYDGVFPQISADSTQVESFDRFDPDSTSTSFWSHLVDAMHRKGIVVSFSEGGVNELKGLLLCLRVLQNTLPIQLVHKGDVSQDSMADLVRIGRDLEVMNSIQQDIWFVNTERCLAEGSGDQFSRFSNKWIASLFNSFEEMILMDSDVVPFINPFEFFQTKEYIESGALFYRDRAANEYINSGHVEFYKKLLPGLKDHMDFEIPLVGNQTMENDFFKHHYKQLMESGAVVMNRKERLPGLLISTSMQLWEETSEPLYGDKELWWLGQSISGNENYAFNKNYAGAIGIVKSEGDDKNVVCSTKLAHFSDDFKLLWINGGLQNCKKSTWKIDYQKNSKLRKDWKSVEALEKWYKSPLEIDGAIIPVHNNVPLLQRIFGDPIGFQKCPRLGCIGYYWCAHDHNGATLVQFDDDQKKWIKSIVNLWNANI
ncbi:unnamed protein product [Wickerhamomyces anomalus]